MAVEIRIRAAKLLAAGLVSISDDILEVTRSPWPKLPYARVT
jgi:hypothetical protein